MSKRPKALLSRKAFISILVCSLSVYSTIIWMSSFYYPSIIGFFTPIVVGGFCVIYNTYGARKWYKRSMKIRMGLIP